MDSTTEKLTDSASKLSAGYPESEPLPAYLALMGCFAVVFLSFFGRSRRASLPPSPFAQAVLFAVGTHKLSRILALDRVTAPLRAPFVRYEKSAGAGELEEQARGRGFQRAVGNLVSCPYCVAPWVALGLKVARKVAPGPAGHARSLLGMVAVSDFLNVIYARLKDEG